MKPLLANLPNTVANSYTSSKENIDLIEEAPQGND